MQTRGSRLSQVIIDTRISPLITHYMFGLDFDFVFENLEKMVASGYELDQPSSILKRIPRDVLDARKYSFLVQYETAERIAEREPTTAHMQKITKMAEEALSAVPFAPRITKKSIKRRKNR